MLHDGDPIYHRDIRWQNVTRSITNSSWWFVIDIDDSSERPTKAAPTLRADIHSPHVFKDGHGAEVDIEGVGNLIMTADVGGLPGDLLSLGQRLLDGSISSASQGLEESKSL